MDPLNLLSALGSPYGSGLLLGAPAWLVIAYALLWWHSRLEGSSSRDDGQIGLKAFAFFVLIAGLGIAASGGVGLLHYLLSATKAGKDVLKQAIAALIAGAAPVFAVTSLVLPRTNSAAYPRAARLCAGFIGVVSGYAALTSFHALLDNLIEGAGWLVSSASLASLLVFGALTIAALARLGALSGWTVPPRPGIASPPPGYGQHGGYGPSGGYGPDYSQGGGYSPPGGGYPPQGGGYPPQGGGYPPR